MPERHVRPDRQAGGWIVTAAGEASNHTTTQAEAIEHAREALERVGGGDLIVHGVDGHVRETRSVQPS